MNRAIDRFRSSICAVLFGAALWLGFDAPALAQVNVDQRAPEMATQLAAAACDSLQPPPGHAPFFHTYAVGVQTYRWNGSAWVFVEPVATLYADATYSVKVGTHYAGPTWQSNDGSKVAAARLAGCTVDAASIPWLLLQVTAAEGTGPLSHVTYIQRLNTKGGLAPIAPGVSIGVTAEVPYTADYFFYRAQQ